MKKFLKHNILRLKIWKYKFLSTNAHTIGKPKRIQPLLIEGDGKLHFGNNVSFGIYRAPYLYSGYSYVEARGEKSEIFFEANVAINNSCVITAEKKITISKNTVIGYNCHISDSSFHNLATDIRHETDPNPEEVHIGENVFIGNNVTILKGVKLGKNVVVGSGAIVTKSFPDNVVIAGVPAKIVSEIS
ncbi:acyltransferase [Kordia sp. YSTF-M3]|uniref:Acyltransferase n=1 Tax=Kordia aestuariivivens TaxID=2759037 RepID=A0ABR7QBT6_9FLAO|nr:acyltransferase [Kordia aestuariivivens]MBC8756030.1 acyltransferase [Kordia aestuariivivens]